MYILETTDHGKFKHPIRFEMKSKHTKSAWFQRGDP